MFKANRLTSLLLTLWVFSVSAEDLIFTGPAHNKIGQQGTAIYTIKRDGSGKRQITPSARIRSGSVSTRGKKLAFFKYPSVYTCNWDGSNPIDIVPTPREQYQPKWSPDGETVVYATDLNNDSEVYSIRYDGSEEQNLTWKSLSSEMSPAFSHDGEHIVFISNRRGQFDLFIMRKDGLDQRAITSGKGNCREPAWSPGGKHIAYANDITGDLEIYLIEIDSKKITRLTHSPSFDGQPAFSPDGKTLAFVSDRDGGSDIFTLELTSKKIINITRTPKEDELYPQWVPTQISDQAQQVSELKRSSVELSRPRMLFTSKELPALREKFQRKPHKHPWNLFLKNCDKVLDPESKVSKRIEADFAKIPTIPRLGHLRTTNSWLKAAYELGFAYQVTQDKKYAKRGVELLVKGCTIINLNIDDSNFLVVYYRIDPELISCAYDWLHAEIPESERRIVRKLLTTSCGASLKAIMKHSLGLGPGSDKKPVASNYTLIFATQLGMPALTLMGEKGYKPVWLSASKRMLNTINKKWFDENGACGCGAAYLSWVGKMGLPLMISLEKNGIGPKLEGTNLIKWPKWMVMSSPHGATQTLNINDHSGGRPRFPVGFFELMPDNPLLDFLYSIAKRPEAPRYTVPHLLWWRPSKKDVDPAGMLPRSTYFPHLGFAVMRQGYGLDDPMMTLRSHHYGGHSHAEAGSLLLYAYQNNFLVDTGYGDIDAGAHNQIFVNGRGPAPPGPKRSRPPIKQTFSGQLAHVVSADSRDAFAKSQKGYLDYTVPLPWYPLKKAERNLAMVHDKSSNIPAYYLCADDYQRNADANLFESVYTSEQDNEFHIKDHSFTIKRQYSGEWFYRTAKLAKKMGHIDYKFKVEKAGSYHLWLYVKGERSEQSILLDGNPISTHSRRNDICWQWSRPVKRGQKVAPALKLTAGEHTLTFKHPSYPFATALLVPDAKYKPKDVHLKGLPTGSLVLKAEDGVIHGDGWVRHRDGATLGLAQFHFLNPDPIQFKVESYTYYPRHFGAGAVVRLPRMVASRNSVNPRFLKMVYPKTPTMEQPQIERFKQGDMLYSRIRWKSATDHVFATLGNNVKNDIAETDAKLALVRESQGKLQHFAIGASRLVFNGRTLLNQKDKTTVIVPKLN